MCGCITGAGGAGSAEAGEGDAIAIVTDVGTSKTERSSFTMWLQGSWLIVLIVDSIVNGEDLKILCADGTVHRPMNLARGVVSRSSTSRFLLLYRNKSGRTGNIEPYHLFPPPHTPMNLIRIISRSLRLTISSILIAASSQAAAAG